MSIIIGLKLSTGKEYAPKFQAILSHYSCAIQTRLGLHQTGTNYCQNYGIILLHIVDENVLKYIQNDLLEIDGIEMQMMKF